jgi:hypothetical protein
MVTLLTIEPINEAHGMLIVEAFNMFFIDRGGQEDGAGNGNIYGNGYVYGDGDGFGDGDGDGYGDGGCTYSGKCPEEWQAE